LLRALVLGLASVAGLMAADFDWNLPKGFPRPAVPADNPMSAAKIELGRDLFYDKRMSVNGKESCGSCHRQELAFTDGRAHAQGTTGQLHPRGAMSLVNVAYAQSLTWANPSLTSLEEQALTPMLGEEPIELGLKGHEREFLNVLRRDAAYRKLFPEAFPGERDPYDLSHVTKAIAAFERTIVSMRSPYDRYRWGGICPPFRTRQSGARSFFPPANAADVFSATARGISAVESGLREVTTRNAKASRAVAFSTLELQLTTPRTADSMS
jgi:cytochrome c peroxidase